MSSDALSKLTRTMDKNKTQDVLADLKRVESDRGAALLGCSVVEYALKFFMMKHMINLTSQEEGSLFHNSGPLSDFSGRIGTSYAFGLINAEMRDDMMLLKVIRNAFGHSPQSVKFEHDAIKARCARFKALRIMKTAPDQPRDQYVSSAQLIFSALKFAGVRKELPLPFGTPGNIWAAPAPEAKEMPSPEISLEQFLQDLERLRPEDNTP